MLFRPFPVVLVTLLALGAVASTSVAAVGGATPQIVLLDPGTNAQTKATREQRRGNDVTDVYTHAVDGFAAMLDPADIARLKADPSVMSIEPDARVSIDAAAANDMFANATVVSASSGSKTGAPLTPLARTANPGQSGRGATKASPSGTRGRPPSPVPCPSIPTAAVTTRSLPSPPDPQSAPSPTWGRTTTQPAVAYRAQSP